MFCNQTKQRVGILDIGLNEKKENNDCFLKLFSLIHIFQTLSIFKTFQSHLSVSFDILRILRLNIFIIQRFSGLSSFVAFKTILIHILQLF